MAPAAVAITSSAIRIIGSAFFQGNCICQTKFNASLEPKLESVTMLFPCGRGDAARLRI
jgi:hypothetical protein